MRRAHRTVILPLTLWLAGPAASAASVSWNLDNNSTVGGDGAGSFPSLDATAGAALVGGWVNTWPDNPLTDLRDDSGTSTTIDISYGSTNGTWAIAFSHPGQDADGSWSREMLNGYLNAGGGGTSTVTLSEIAYSTYDLYVYFSADVADREGSVTDGASTYYFRSIGPASTAGADAVLTRALDESDDAVDEPANYAVFTGLSGGSTTVTVDIPNFGGIAGVQVVDTTIPEPSVALLGGLGLLGLLRRRRA